MVTKRWSTQRPAVHPHDENSAPPPPPSPLRPRQSSSDSRPGHLGNSHAKPKPRTHARSQSWLSNLLKPSKSSKRRSKEPTPRPGRPLLADRQKSDDSVSALPQRRPSVVTRKPVPVITRVDSEEHPPRQATLNKELLRSSSMPIHLALRPLPVAVAEDEKARWNWETGGGVGEEPPRSRTDEFTRLPSHSPMLERRALEPQPRSRSSAHASTSTSGRRTGPASPPVVPAKDRPLSDVAPSEVCDSRRTSGGSDASADIAFSGPILHNPPPLLPLIASNGTSLDGLVRPERRNRSLSPIFETESSSLCLSSATSAIDLPPILSTTTTTAMVATVQSTSTFRPILHVDPYISSSRKASAYTASVYSTYDQDLRSHFSPATPPEELLQSQLGGLAISGIASHAAIAPSVPASPVRVVGPPPASIHAPSGYAFALANKPSFSQFRFPVASPAPAPAPTPASSDSSKAPSLLDNDDAGLIAPEDIDGAPSSTLTAATSTFESPPLALAELKSSTSSSAASYSAAVPLDDSGLWRSGWSLESPSATRRSTPAVELETEKEVGVTHAAGTVQNVASTSRSPAPTIPPAAAAAVQAEPQQPTPSSESRPVSVLANSKPSARQIRPVSFALPEDTTTTSSQNANHHADPKEEEEEDPTSPAAPSQVFDLGTRTLSVQRKKSKVLPAIPDTASIWSGDDRVEVYCQRELVRHHHGRTERIVLERTLLYGEGEAASRNVVGMAV